jgi:hypothetical protein
MAIAAAIRRTTSLDQPGLECHRLRRLLRERTLVALSAALALLRGTKEQAICRT